MTDRFRDADAFRRALEHRIGEEHRRTAVSHERLRKDIGFHRFLARLAAVGSDRWALKGGVAILWRTDLAARATRDIDANWSGSLLDLERVLDEVLEMQLGDWFEFSIGPPTPLAGEAEGGARYAVGSRVAGREFTRFRLDVNVVTGRGDVDQVLIRQPALAFAGLEELEIPVIPVRQQLAEKLHAVARIYAGGGSSRVKDAYDTVLLVQSAQTDTAGEVRRAVESTFERRRTSIPGAAPEIPDGWNVQLERYLSEHVIPGVADVPTLASVWTRFWDPVLESTVPPEARWDDASFNWAPTP